MEPVLSVRDLQVGYGSYVLMRNVTFDVAKGDIFFIMGGSGCGKSTLLHVLMGLKSPQAGEVFLAMSIFGAALPLRGGNVCAMRVCFSKAAPSGVR